MNAAITSGIVVLPVLLFMVIVPAKTVCIVRRRSHKSSNDWGVQPTSSAGLHILVPCRPGDVQTGPASRS